MQSFNILNDLYKNDAIILNLRDQIAFLCYKINFLSHFILFKSYHIYNIMSKFVAIISLRYLCEKEFQLFKITLFNYRDRNNNKKNCKKKLNHIQ